METIGFIEEYILLRNPLAISTDLAAFNYGIYFASCSSPIARRPLSTCTTTHTHLRPRLESCRPRSGEEAKHERCGR